MPTDFCAITFASNLHANALLPLCAFDGENP
jgi:hypothetical protein